MKNESRVFQTTPVRPTLGTWLKSLPGKRKEAKALHEKRKEARPRIQADRRDFRKALIQEKHQERQVIALARKKARQNKTSTPKMPQGNLRVLTQGLLANPEKAFYGKLIQDAKDNYAHQRYVLRRKRKAYEDDLVAEGLKGKLTFPEALNGLLFLLPWFVGFCLLTLYPILETLIYSFNDVTITIHGIKTSFIGFQNYLYAFTEDTAFVTALQNYLIKILLYVPVITVISLGLALLLNSKVKGTGFFRTIFFLPVIITSGPVIKIFIDQGVASFPNIDKLIDFSKLSEILPGFLVTALSFLTSEFIMILWFCGIQILVFLTGLQKIDKSVYEAAAIDGASKWECFWKVTLPAINPVVVINVVFTVVMQSVFSLNPVIEKIQADMRGSGEGKGYGYASAMAWIYFLILIVVLVFFVLLFKKHTRKRRASL